MSISLRLICSMMVIMTSLSKLCDVVFCRKCSVSSQLLTPFNMVSVVVESQVKGCLALTYIL